MIAGVDDLLTSDSEGGVHMECKSKCSEHVTPRRSQATCSFDLGNREHLDHRRLNLVWRSRCRYERLCDTFLEWLLEMPEDYYLSAWPLQTAHGSDGRAIKFWTCTARE